MMVILSFMTSLTEVQTIQRMKGHINSTVYLILFNILLPGLAYCPMRSFGTMNNNREIQNKSNYSQPSSTCTLHHGHCTFQSYVVLLYQVTKTKKWHKIYLRIEQGDTVENGVKKIVDIVKIVVDCKLYDKIVLDTPREPEMNLNGYTSVGRDVNDDKIRV